MKIPSTFFKSSPPFGCGEKQNRQRGEKPQRRGSCCNQPLQQQQQLQQQQLRQQQQLLKRHSNTIIKPNAFSVISCCIILIFNNNFLQNLLDYYLQDLKVISVRYERHTSALNKLFFTEV